MLLTIGMITGEASGDLLGADLVLALRNTLLATESKYTELKIVGVLGPQIIKLAETYANISVELLYDAEALAIMGFVEPLKQLPRLLSMRKKLIQHFTHQPPNIFIGIDSPDFNLGIEKKLKQHNIKTIHYVSPSVWAWRKGRIKTIKKAVDLMLVLFPFEKKFYQDQQVNAIFVGHPLADAIPLACDKLIAREALRLSLEKSDSPVLAILPGSRLSEIEYLAPLYLETALRLKAKMKDLTCVIPIASEKIAEKFDVIRSSVDPENTLNLVKINGQAQSVMQASDVVLIASGTATLEAMLCKRPMVVAFKTSRLNALIAKLFIKLKYFSLPNLLFDKKVVPEFFQEQATVDALERELMAYFENRKNRSVIEEQFIQMHQSLKMQAGKQAAAAVLALL